MTVPAMSSGLVSLSVPRGALPTAVRNDETITASFIGFVSNSPSVVSSGTAHFFADRDASNAFLCVPLRPLRLDSADPKELNRRERRGTQRQEEELIPQRLAGLQHVLNPFLSLLLAAQRNKRLAFEIQQILLRHQRLMRQVAASDYVSQLLRYVRVVLADELASHHHVNRKLDRRKRRLTKHWNVSSRMRLRVALSYHRKRCLLCVFN